MFCGSSCAFHAEFSEKLSGNIIVILISDHKAIDLVVMFRVIYI